MARKRVFFILAVLAIGLTACGYPAGTGGPTVSTPTSKPTQGVALELSKTSYATGDTIEVTVRNNLGSEIIASDHQTSCSIVTLQMKVHDAWEKQGGCAMGVATRRVPLAAGSATPVEVAPGGGQLTTKPWSAGTYRVAFAYQPGGSALTADAQTVYSSEFTIG